jgi:ABC-type glycerol-3-phosphate transport system substrate-binding protein
MSSETAPTFISRRRFVGLAVAGMASITLAACRGSGSGQAPAGGQPTAGGQAGVAPTSAAAAQAPAQAGGAVTSIKWSTWGNPGEIERFKQFTDDFNKRTPSIKAELIPIPNDGYEAKMLTQLSGGTAPDVFYAPATAASGNSSRLARFWILPTRSKGPRASRNRMTFLPVCGAQRRLRTRRSTG